MSGYVKIFSSILDSSVWAEPPATRCVWLAMLNMCDAEGRVEASPSGLARRANVSLAECRTATETLEAPDLESKSPEWGGRRIEKVEGGWLILNYKKYREMQSPKQLAAAERQARFRARQAEEGLDGDARDEALRNGHKTPTVDVDEAVSVTVPATSKEEGEASASPIAKIDDFLAHYDFGQWRDIVEGYIRASRRPVNIMAHLKLHLTGEMGYKQRTGTDLGFALNQYAGSGQAEFIAVLFDGYVRRVKAQLDRNVGNEHRQQEDMSIARERREREERAADERDQALLIDFEQANPEKFAELRATAERSVPKNAASRDQSFRDIMVRTELIRLVRKAA